MHVLGLVVYYLSRCVLYRNVCCVIVTNDISVDIVNQVTLRNSLGM